MERQIKFRAWDYGKKIFLPKKSYVILSEKEFGAIGIMTTDFEDYQQGEYLYPHSQVLSQFTGLKDKNGVDIYEGDILAFENTLNFKTVLQNYFEIKWEDYGNGMVGFTQFSPINKFVVIGNIYENPNLLQDGK